MWCYSLIIFQVYLSLYKDELPRWNYKIYIITRFLLGAQGSWKCKTSSIPKGYKKAGKVWWFSYVLVNLNLDFVKHYLNQYVNYTHILLSTL